MTQDQGDLNIPSSDMLDTSMPIPKLTKSILVDMGGWAAYKEAKHYVDNGAVKECVWESPLLKGRVEFAGQIFFPKISLRSTTFPENTCSCVKGRQGMICAHALALCNYMMAAPPKNDPTSSTQGSPAEALPILRVFKCTDGKGTPLQFRIFLPPNLAQTAPRDSMVIKIDGCIKGRLVPLEHLDKNRLYKMKPAAYRTAALLEAWCGNQFFGILQVNRARLRELLRAVQGDNLVYWANQSEKPIQWVSDKLPAVHMYLEENPEDLYQVKANAPMSPAGTFASAPPVALPQVEPMHVDGSPNYLAITLPSRESAVYGPALELLKHNGFQLEPANRQWWLRDRHKVLNFLARYWKQLKDQWDALFSRTFRQQMSNIKFAELNCKASEVGKEFAIKIELKAGKAKETDLSQAILRGQHYIEVGKQVFLIDPICVEKMTQVQRALTGQPDHSCTPVFSKKLHSAELAEVEALLEQNEVPLQSPDTWRKRSASLKYISKLKPAPILKPLEAMLRPYQRLGVAWLWHLYRNKLGGVLADEMGLGKTVQALAFMSCLRHTFGDRGPCLVVCPAGLVENWRRECVHFTPGLRVGIHHRNDRLEDVAAFENYDLVITSYSTLSRDAELFSSVRFNAVIGDEAQHVKNRQTRNARALRTLQAEGRFLLTGTPLENSLDDLRSLFDFLMPGYLAGMPENTRADEKEWFHARLRQQVAPYILRRSKELVAPELPAKIEQVMYCTLEPTQERMYQQMQQSTEAEISRLELAGANEGAIRFAAFNQLLRLRQVCADPRILNPLASPEDSAKLRAFREILEEAIDGGHRILVFSQFVSVLKLLREELDQTGIRYCYLDGQTKDRPAVCDVFNNDENIPVFLISLKAGGTGLNLTGADTVIHFDPWWNPAAEAQATDRAHRIGQKRVVTSIKLIAANTVEEKVLELQRSKAHLLKDILDASAEANASIGLAEIKALLNIKSKKDTVVLQPVDSHSKASVDRASVNRGTELEPTAARAEIEEASSEEIPVKRSAKPRIYRPSRTKNVFEKPESKEEEKVEDIEAAPVIKKKRASARAPLTKI
jgi:superfamily II DNA or RNA helicase